jgi:tetratricopeptide (TPR) repeat protein
MKIAVYTIAKNEQQFVDRWAMSCADADHRIILDTGSDDLTCELALKAGVQVYAKTFDPWRFDVASHWALGLVPGEVDVCIALDMDEVLMPGWRDALEAAFDPDVDRYRYKYVWSWNPDQSEGLVYGGDKIHNRYGLSWRHPVHEVLKKNSEMHPEVQRWVEGIQIHHHPDSTKSRAQYLPLLELAVEEDPRDDRNRFYLGREYMYNGAKESAAEQFREHLKLSKWAPERAAACRYLYNVTGDAGYLFQALTEDPDRRENYVALAKFYHDRSQWKLCLVMAKAALMFQEKPLDYLCDGDAWSWLPYDLGAIAAYRLEDVDKADEYGRKALSYRTGDERLAQNLDFYRSAASNEPL